MTRNSTSNRSRLMALCFLLTLFDLSSSPAMAGEVKSKLTCNKTDGTLELSANPKDQICTLDNRETPLRSYEITDHLVKFSKFENNKPVKTITAKRKDLIIVYDNKCSSKADILDEQLNQCSMSCEDAAVLDFIQKAKQIITWKTKTVNQCNLQDKLKKEGIMSALIVQRSKEIGAPASGWSVTSTLLIIIPKNSIDNVEKINRLTKISRDDLLELMDKVNFKLQPVA